MLTLIAACDEMAGIGLDGSIPWQCAKDMEFFKNETVGGAVIMGRRTWESLNKSPLPGRMNIVVTRNQSYQTYKEGKDVTLVPSTRYAVRLARLYRSRIYGIGGTQIYKDLLPVAQRILLTNIKGNYNCDTYFPSFDEDDWRIIPTYYANGLEVTDYVRKK